jgi:hypothetical protein
MKLVKAMPQCNKMKTIVLVGKTSMLCLLLMSTGNAMAQATATASATANIIHPIALEKTIDMQFGNVAVSATIPGTAILDPSGTRTAGGAGGVTFPATTGAVSPASFTVLGQPGYSFSISLPAGCILSDGSSHTMMVDNFRSDPPISGMLDATGTQILRVSATLNVAAGQQPGLYQNTSGVPVTVNYD